MPLEQLLLSSVTVIMLMAALAGTVALGNPLQMDRSSDRPVRNHSLRVVKMEAATIEGTISSVNALERTVLVAMSNETVEYRVAAGAEVFKDQRSCKLEMLAAKDFVTLTLNDADSKVVSRIDAFSSR